MTFAGFIYSSLQKIQAPIIRRWYDQMSRIDSDENMIFMNYGWASLDPAPQLPLDPEDEKFRYCIQLYDRVAGAVDLEGRKVLEIGCGRGGGASYVKRYLKPSSMTGLDFAPKGVEFCNRRFGDPSLSFVQGDAQDLRFPDGEFDAVINVESSHCYPCMQGFLEGVARILKPGGHFLYTDYHSAKQLARMRSLFEECGLFLVEEENISPNVLKALELDNDRKKALITRFVPPILRHMFYEFAGMEGTHTFNETMRTGERIYSRFVLQKPVEVQAGEMGVQPSLQTAGA
jgi:SAM-dependent methyltransferase